MDINNQGQTSYQSFLQSLKTGSASDRSAQQRIADTLPHNTDQVSLSYKGAKLSALSSEFFSGSGFTSDKIPQLTERLYQDGFISLEEYRQLGGVADKAPSQITQSVNFLNDFIMSEAIDGDTDGARNLMNAVDVLQRIDERPDAKGRQREKEALEYITGYTELLKDADAPEALVKEFEKVLDVFNALDSVRRQENKTGAITSYASVQEAYDENNKSA